MKYRKYSYDSNDSFRNELEYDIKYFMRSWYAFKQTKLFSPVLYLANYALQQMPPVFAKLVLVWHKVKIYEALRIDFATCVQ